MEQYSEMKHLADSPSTSMEWNTTKVHPFQGLQQLFSMNFYRVTGTSLTSSYSFKILCQQSYVIEITFASLCSVTLSISLARTLQKWGLHTSSNKNKGLSIYTHIPTVRKLWLNMLNPRTKEGGKHLTSTSRSTTRN